MTDLKAMFWKEFRENVNWAILGALGLGVSLAYLISVEASGYTLASVWNDATVTLTLVAPFVGLVLGLLQILPEMRRDRWAFLVHRPASPTRLFFGKVLPGLCLYGLATLLPLGGLLVWYLRYAHLAGPFDIHFLLGAWAAILSGLAFYFAGLLIALRPARWYGSRALPAVFALLAPWAAGTSQEFWQAAGGSLLVVAVLALAAWGSFTTTGQYVGQTKPARSVLGLVLLIGSAAVALALLTTLHNVAFSLLSRLVAFPTAPFVQTVYQLDAQGRPFLVRDEVGQGRARETVTDPSGQVVPTSTWRKRSAKNPLPALVTLYESDPGGGQGRYSDPTCYVQLLGTETADPDTQIAWYYESGARQIVGYAVRGSRLPPAAHASLFGFLGPRGFSRNADESGRFAADAAPANEVTGPPALLRSRHALYAYDTARRTIRLIQASRSAAGIVGVTPVGTPVGAAGLIVQADGLYTVYVDEQMRFTIPASFSPGGSSDVQVAVPPGGSRFYFLYGPGAARGDLHLVTVGADGRVLRTQALPQPPPAFAFTGRLPLQVYLAAPLVPPALAGTPFLVSEFRASTSGQIGLLALLSASMGLLSALLAWRISRRCGDGRRGQIAWALGVFWLGPYGVLMLLALREWPARVSCPNCGRKRVVTRESCEHCGAVFPRPARDGTEIFDAADGDGEGREEAREAVAS